jgi:hypothetical protein
MEREINYVDKSFLILILMEERIGDEPAGMLPKILREAAYSTTRALVEHFHGSPYLKKLELLVDRISSMMGAKFQSEKSPDLLMAKVIATEKIIGHLSL